MVEKKMGKMNEEWLKFEKTANFDHWKKAQEMWAELEQQGDTPPILMANTKQIFAEAFKFPDMATYDFAHNELSKLEMAQTNLNENPDNKILLNKFRDATLEASKNIKH